jgi:hypothetical protein
MVFRRKIGIDNMREFRTKKCQNDLVFVDDFQCQNNLVFVDDFQC